MNPVFFFISQWKEYKSRVFMGLLLSLALAFSSIALLALSGWFIAASAFAGLSTLSAANFDYFLPASIIRYLALLRIGSRYADRVINHDLTFEILAKLRVWFYEKLMPLSPAKLLSTNSGDLLNRMVNDIDTLDHLYLNVLSPFLISIILIVSTTGFIAYFSGLLAIIACIGMLSSTVIITLLALKRGASIGHTIQIKIAQLRTTALNALQHFVDLALFLKKSEREILLDADNEALILAQRKEANLKGVIIALMIFASGITLFLMLFFGIKTNSNGAILTMLLLLIVAVFDQLLTLPLSALFLGKTKAAANRVIAITTEKPTVVFSKNESVTTFDLMIDRISFHYPHHQEIILNNFSANIPEKTHLAISGFSGIGKSTLLNLIARIYDPKQGAIFLSNTNLKNIGEKTLRDTISLVTQQVHIFNGTILDNLTLMNNTYSEEHCFSILEKMKLADVITQLPEKLQTPMGEFGQQFSGGQIRRIALARALLHDAPILLLDEPSTGLDASTFDLLWKNCESIFAKKTLIVATHDKKVLEKTHQIITL